MLVDGEAYFEAFMLAAQKAQRSIVILAWDFNSHTPLRFGEDGKPALLLGDFLNGLAKRNRALQIHVLDWDYPMIFGTDREFPPIYGMSWKPHRRVHLRYDNTHPTAGSHHQKIVVIDSKLAFVGRLDLTSKRWDTPSHGPDDPRRSVDGEGYPPFHDMMIAVDGDAAVAVDNIARRRWESATRHALNAVSVAADPWPEQLEPQMTEVNVGIACTAPDTGDHKGVRDIEQLYLDMIARARRYIYIENQYFTAQRIGEALAARLAEPEGPEIVLVTRLLSHGWLEEMTMHVLRTRLIKLLRAADMHHRFEVYYPHVEGLKEGTCVDVHSKVMVVDDEWLRVGSSNISNHSMGMDTECDVVVDAAGDEGDMRAIRAFRDSAVAEHAGVEPTEFTKAVADSGGMIAAIGQLGTPARKLMPLGDLPEYSDALIDAVSITEPERPVSLDMLVSEFQTESPQSPQRLPWKKAAPILRACCPDPGLALYPVVGLGVGRQRHPMGRTIFRRMVGADRADAALHARQRDHVPATGVDADRGRDVRAMARISVRDDGRADRGNSTLLCGAAIQTRHGTPPGGWSPESHHRHPAQSRRGRPDGDPPGADRALLRAGTRRRRHSRPPLAVSARHFLRHAARIARHDRLRRAVAGGI